MLKSIALVAVALVAFSTVLRADDFFIYKATVKLPVTRVKPGSGNTAFETLILKNNDLINLALGRALDFPVDGKHEVLAIRGTYEDTESNAAAKSTLVVFDPDTTDVDPVRATVFTFSNLYYRRSDTASAEKNLGYAMGSFAATSHGDTNVGGLFATDVTAAASAGLVVKTFFNDNNTVDYQTGALSLKVTSMAGSMKFTYTKGGVTDTFDGLIIKGAFKTTPKAIAMYSL